MDSQLKRWYVKIAPGMNNKTEDLDLQDKWVELAQNCRFEEEPKAVVKRDPVTYYNDDFTGIVGGGAGAIVGLYRFYSSTGTIKFLMVHNTTAYIGDDATGTWAPIRTGLTTGKRMAFETYRDQCIMSNGFDQPFVTDGEATNVSWELGACKAVIGGGAGITQTGISYKITFDADAVASDAVSNTIASTTNESIELTNIPLGPVGTTDRKIYRDDSNTVGYRLVATLADNTTTTYTDTTNDVSAGAIYPTVTDTIPKGSILKIHRERLFISGDPGSPNKIYYSNVYLPHFIQQTTNLDYMEISPEDGDEIMGIPITLSIMMCVKKNSIRRVHITSPTTGADPKTWYADDPQAWVGSPAQWSITQTQYGIIFLGWDSWYRFDGSKAVKIFDEFDTEEILPSSYSDVVGFYHKGIFLAAYSDNTIAAQFHNRIMRYNFQRISLGVDLWTSSTISGANCFAAKTGDDETGELYYGDSAMAYVVKAKESENVYRLRTKTECNEGAQTNVFIGGTENAPYIEIGADTAATTIPDNLCILWDSNDDAPPPEWVEITGFDGRHIKISTAAVGTTDDAVGISGTSLIDLNASHYRVFKSVSNTETEFPTGAVIIWDQPTLPTGYSEVGELQYININTTVTSTTSIDSPSSESGTAGNIDNTLGVYLIKKIGEADTWDGVDKYAYCLWYSDGATSNGWTDVTSSYDGYFLKGAPAGATPAITEGGDTEYPVDFVQYLASHAEASVAENTPPPGTGQSGITTYWKGIPEDAYDGNLGTYREWHVYHNWDGTAYGELTHTHTWDVERDIDEVTWKTGFGAYGGNYRQNEYRTTIYLKISGVWTQIATRFRDFAGPDSTWYYEDWQSSSTTGWSNVTGMRVHMTGDSYSYEGDRRQQVKLRIYNVTCEGNHKSVSFRLARKVLGQMKTFNDAILSQYTAGTWTAPAQQIDAETMKDIFWNETNQAPSTDDILFYTRSGATQVACEAAPWSASLTNPNGSAIVTAANVWFQYKIEFSAVDTRDDNPRVYFTNAFVVKYTYEKGNIIAEDSVNFHYDIGPRNFDTPMEDKIFKKIQTVHYGTEGSFTVNWITENANDSFTVDLSLNNERWESFFQSTAMGRRVNFLISKNDLNDFTIKELQGAYTMEPTII